MCGRYVLKKNAMDAGLLKIQNACAEIMLCTNSDNEISPGMNAAALISNNGTYAVHQMRWGFVGKNHGTIINARIEDVYDRDMFKGLIQRQRCVLPASAYFEWRRGDRQKFLIHPENREGICFLAGLYKSDNRGQLSFVILTRAAEGQPAAIHDRMPVLFADENMAINWLVRKNASDLSGACTNLTLEAEGNEQMSIFN